MRCCALLVGSIAILHGTMLVNAVATEAILGSAYGVKSVEIFDFPNGKRIKKIPGARLYAVQIIDRMDGFVRLDVTGEEWVRESDVDIGDAVQEPMVNGGTDFGSGSTQGTKGKRK